MFKEEIYTRRVGGGPCVRNANNSG